MDIQELLTRLEKDPENTDIILAIGKYYKQKIEFDKAQKYIGLALEKDPDNAQAMCSMVHLLMDYGHYKEGLDTFTQALENHSENEAYRATLINALFALFLLHKLSLSSGQSQFPVEHNYEEFFFKIGATYKYFHLYDAAMKVYETAFILSPLNARLVLDLTDCYIYLKEYQKAEKTLLNILVNYPEDMDILTKLCEIYNHILDYDKSISYAYKMLAIDPSNMNAQNILAYSYMNNNEHDRAIEIYKNQLTTTPDIYEPYKNLFLAYKLAQKTDEAESLLEYLIEHKPCFAEMLAQEIKVQYQKLEDELDTE
jgi:tetratricopeptide (TPR) repeat protein